MCVGLGSTWTWAWGGVSKRQCEEEGIFVAPKIECWVRMPCMHLHLSSTRACRDPPQGHRAVRCCRYRGRTVPTQRVNTHALLGVVDGYCIDNTSQQPIHTTPTYRARSASPAHGQSCILQGQNPGVSSSSVVSSASLRHKKPQHSSIHKPWQQLKETPRPSSCRRRWPGGTSQVFSIDRSIDRSPGSHSRNLLDSTFSFKCIHAQGGAGDGRRVGHRLRSGAAAGPARGQGEREAPRRTCARVELIHRGRLTVRVVITMRMKSQVVIMGRRAQFLEQAAALLAKDGIQAACKSIWSPPPSSSSPSSCRVMSCRVVLFLTPIVPISCNSRVPGRRAAARGRRQGGGQSRRGLRVRSPRLRLRLHAWADRIHPLKTGVTHGHDSTRHVRLY